MSPEMTAYKLALKYNLDQDLAYQLEVLDIIPIEEREGIVRGIVGVIRKYREDQRKWKYAKELGIPKQTKEIKRSVRKLHQETINIAVRYLRVILPNIVEPDDKEESIRKLKRQLISYATEYVSAISPSTIEFDDNEDQFVERLYAGMTPISLNTLMEAVHHIQELYAMDIDKQVDEQIEDFTPRQPNKEEIKKAIKLIFSHYKIGAPTDFMRDFLPYI